MKKLKVLAAILAFASLTLSSVAFVYASEVKDEEAAPIAAAEATEAEVVEEPTPTPTPAKVYDNLAVVEKSYFNYRGSLRGVYPVVTGLDDLSAKILADLEDKYLIATDRPETDQLNAFSVEYKVTDEGQYAVIEVTYNYKLTSIKTEPFSETNKYYVDKETKKEITEEDYTAAKKAEEEAKEAEEAPAEETAEEEVEEEIAEIILVPLREYAESLGYAVGWNGELQLITILSGEEIVTTISIGKNEYNVDDAIVPLEAAPELQDGVTYVPVSFFEKVLGAVYSVGTDGEISIAAAAE
jgi:hypothetical protein